MLFIDENGEPKLIKHICEPSRNGQLMSIAELHKFGVELLVELYKDNGMIIRDINRISGYEYPQFIMESKNGKVYYVAVKTTVYPNDPFSLPKNDCNEIKGLAKQFNAIPVFAGIGFANIIDMKKAFCGGAFFVSYKGLQPL